MLKKLTGSGKSSAVGVHRRATISQADEITNATPASQTPTQELKRYVIGHCDNMSCACAGLFQCFTSDVMLDWFCCFLLAGYDWLSHSSG